MALLHKISVAQQQVQSVFRVTSHYPLAFNSMDCVAFLIVDVVHHSFTEAFLQKAVLKSLLP